MENQFNNFMEAEVTAEIEARKTFLGNEECFAFFQIRERKNGRPFTDKEINEGRFIENEAIRDLRRKNLEQYIIDGLVRDCMMSRRFMASLKVYK